MDPSNNQGDRRNAPVPPNNTDSTSGPENNAPNPGYVDTNANVTDRQATYCSGFTMIPPNNSRRSEITTMAQKEEEDFQRYKESQRVTSVQLPPERLGGHVTLAEAREKQHQDLKHFKGQKKMKKVEMDKRRRLEEEQELQKKKAVQRENAERLNKSRRDEQQRRKEELSQDHLRRNELYLQHLESSSASSQTFSSAAKTPPELNTLTKSLRDVKMDHRRVNSAFLDKVEARGDEQQPQSEEFRGGIDHSEVTDPTGPTGLTTYFNLSEDADTERERVLVKLMRRFPDCIREVLEEILDQCDGDYQRAHDLLNGSS